MVDPTLMTLFYFSISYNKPILNSVVIKWFVILMKQEFDIQRVVRSDYTGHETESVHIPPFTKFKSNRKQLKLRKNYQIVPLN